MSDATLARMEHGKYVGVRKESRRDGVCTLKGQTLYTCDVVARAGGHAREVRRVTAGRETGVPKDIREI